MPSLWLHAALTAFSKEARNHAIGTGSARATLHAGDDAPLCWLLGISVPKSLTHVKEQAVEKSTERSYLKRIHFVVGTTDLFDEAQGVNVKGIVDHPNIWGRASACSEGRQENKEQESKVGSDSHHPLKLRLTTRHEEL